MNILRTWAKFPQLQGKKLVLTSSCLPDIFPSAYKSFLAKIGTNADGTTDPTGIEVMDVCPEADLGALIYGKLASMCRSTPPREILVLTIEGSPHCFTLHASVNEAMYILGDKLPTRHFICINDEDVREIKPDAVRLARYLHLVDRLVGEHPEIMQQLERLSLEYKAARSRRAGGLGPGV